MWSWFFYFYWKLEVYKTTQLAELSSYIHTKCWTEICLICSPVYHLLAFLCWSFPVGNYCWQFSFTPINSGLLEQHRVREAQVLFGSSLDWRKKCTSLLFTSSARRSRSGWQLLISCCIQKCSLVSCCPGQDVLVMIMVWISCVWGSVLCSGSNSSFWQENIMFCVTSGQNFRTLVGKSFVCWWYIPWDRHHICKYDIYEQSLFIKLTSVWPCVCYSYTALHHPALNKDVFLC